MELYEYQKKAQAMLGQEKMPNMLIIAPTGAGKTEVGEMALTKFGKGVYIVPTRALGYEKRNKLQEDFPNAEVILGNKDWKLSCQDFRQSDIRVMTHFKLRQFLMTLNGEFTALCPVVVLDEVHNLDPNMELIITCMKLLYPSVRCVGLSATVHEDDEPKLANWLDASIVKSDERPVPIIEHIFHFDPDINDEGNEVTNVKIIESGKVVDQFQLDHALAKCEHIAVIDNYIREKMQDTATRLVYSPYRWPATNIAQFIADSKEVSDEKMSGIAESLPGDVSEFTWHLKNAIAKRIGIHHGGLSQHERETVQNLAQTAPGQPINFDLIVTCETLAQGVNLPARHLIMDTIYVFDDETKERRLIDVSRFRQIEGRAGRPQYDTIGHCWIPVFSEIEKTEVEEVLLKFKASRIESRIYDQYFLEGLTPMLLALGWNTPEKFVTFIKATYWGMSLQETQPLIDQFERIVAFLIDHKVARVINGKLVLTRQGRLMARLGTHPLEYEVMEGLSRAGNLSYEEWTEQLARVCFKYVCGPNYDEEGMSSQIISEVVEYGLSVYAAKVKHESRELADYVQRLFDITMSFLHFNPSAAGYTRNWREEVYNKYMFGQLEMARNLSKVLRRDEVKRLIRNLGQTLANSSLDESSQKELIKQIWGNLKEISPGVEEKIRQVAETIGENPEAFLEKVRESRNRDNKEENNDGGD